MKKNRLLTLIVTFFVVLSALACTGQGHSNTASPSPKPTSLLLNTMPPFLPDGLPAESGFPTSTPVPYNPIIQYPCFPLSIYPKVDGSTACIPLAESLISVMTGCSQEEAESIVDLSSTDPSFRALANGDADFLLAYEPSESIIDELDPFTKMDMIPIAMDALVFIVNEANPVRSISIEDIQGIYTGRIKNWKELGGNDIPIVAFQRPDYSGGQALMRKLCMKNLPMMEPAEGTVSESMSDIIQDVASYRDDGGAIGYSVYYFAQNMFTMPGIRFIEVECSMPSTESINYMSYPLVTPIYAVLPKGRYNPYAQAIVAWLKDEVGQQFLLSCGYVPLMVIDD